MKSISFANIQSATIEGFAVVITVKLQFWTDTLLSKFFSSFVVMFTSCYQSALNVSND